MRLKQLQVHGFKTFANPTTFHFQEGITAIVGPNGCGKSNIADAIRWALGEQSPSNLRTKKTEDLIFTGSATRPKMGMAEVALTLENPFALEEQAQQNADDENAARANPEASDNDSAPQPERRPSGIVEEILRTRPTEVTVTRRAYRSGENEYLINRQRVRLRDVHELLQRWGLARLTYAVIGQGLIDQALSLRAEERRSLFEEAAGIGLYQNKKANALEKLEETQQNLLRVNDIINEIAPRLPSLARQADRAGKYEAVSTALSEKLRAWYAFNWAHAQEGFIVAQTQENDTREKLNAQRAAMQELGAQLTEARRAAQTLRAKLTDHRRELQQRENEFATVEREYAVLQERARFAESQENDAQREMDAALVAEQNAVAAFEAFHARPLTLSIAETPAPEQNANVQEPSPEAIAQQLAEYEAFQRREIEKLHNAARMTDEQHAAHFSQIETDAQRAEENWHAENERLARADEQNLLEQRAHAEQHAAKLEQERALMEAQRARAIAQQRLAQLRAQEFESPAQTRSAETQAPPDLAAHLISLQENLPLYESALAEIAGLAAQADDMARRERELRERERMQERVRMEMSVAQNAFVLAERDVKQARLAETNAQRERERAERERMQERERNRRERERERERLREQFAREREKIARERERLKREHEQLVRDRERMIQERAREMEREREMQVRERERLAREQERERERAEREYLQAQERVARERERAELERVAKATRLANFSAQLITLREQRAELQARADAMRDALDEFRALALPDENALGDSEALQNELEEREANLRSDLIVAEELHNRAVLEAERRRAEIARLEQEIEDDLGPVELDSAAPRQLRLRLVARNRASSASSGEEGDAPVETEVADAPEELITLPHVDALPDGYDKEIRRLKNQMRYIGNVNPNAPQEYAELKERHAFLTEQAADLTQALERIHLAIQELDAMMKQKFQDTFNAINTEFKKYFTILFGGGTARLELTDPNDLIKSGIEITARPPGKRAAQLVLLSGGERALTAAALIFSILRVSPTPFCVMDEVDAALDEANVGRFRDGLKELVGATQFIVITHNRVTMEGARAIYGVSMGEDGVSQVLSLKLEEAAANVR